MPKLLKATDKKLLLPELRVADTYWTRMKGLLGTQQLSERQGMWINRGNSIHTFFMNFSIDCVFLDKSMRIKSIVENVVPYRIVLPVFGASSVLELKSGQARSLGLEVGESLHVVD